MSKNRNSTSWQYGFLGFLGFIGLLIGEYPLCTFFMMFLSFCGRGERTDERWNRSIYRASQITVLLVLAVLCLSLAFIGTIAPYPPASLFQPLMALLLLACVSVYVLSFAYFDRRGD
jgi:hypothetical protein